MINRIISYVILVLFLLFTLIIPSPIDQYKVSAASTSFYDLSPSYWASKEINYLSSRSIISGYQDVKGYYFAPEQTLTRAQAAKMVVYAKGENPATKSSIRFPDVPKEHWAAGWIEKAVQLNIFDGKQDGHFAPDEPLTRSQMAKILVKAFGLTVENDQNEPFADVYINDEYRPYVSTLYQLGIAVGSGDRFNPKKDIKRSEFAAFLTRTLNPSFRINQTLPTQSTPETKPTNSSKTAKVTADILNVRSGPSTKNEVIGQLSFGSIVNIYSFDGNWTKIQYNNQIGYVSTTYLKMDSDTSNSNPTNNVLENQIIVLDAGHGGKDPGTAGNSMLEKDITLDVIELLEKKVKAAGANVILTRDSDTYPTLDDRVKIANQNGADIFVSVHVNSGPSTASGTETYYDTSKNPQSEESKKLASEIHKQIVSLLGMNDRGIKNEEFKVITYTKMPSVLVELGFVTNTEDAKKLADQRGLYADAIYNGILAYYNNK
ncbi:N-acetylmuramoyl-L-alanine amidase [Niallia oryzisoli]|uniref:N-acetylmuramoyl-L-alanine amidase n=1 Tax=Niallia oryzisoli TaxID=1737571 RepID=A0ABZ2CMT1_9BACI